MSKLARLTCLAVALVLLTPALHSAAQVTPTVTPPSILVPWDQLLPAQQAAIRDGIRHYVFDDPVLQQAWANATALVPVDDLVPRIHDALLQALTNLQTVGQDPMAEETLQTFVDVAKGISESLPPPPEPASPQQPSAICIMPTPPNDHSAILQIILFLTCPGLYIVLAVLSLVVAVAMIALGPAMPFIMPFVQIVLNARASTFQPDVDGDGLGDEFVEEWYERIKSYLKPLEDSDGDDLENIDEFRWELIPVCVPPLFPNCKDYDNDGWTDGKEVWYWNNEDNDDWTAPGFAFLDPDRLLDTDGDTIRNVWDPHSDNDTLLDGDEFHIYGTYPEFADSDCSITATVCTHPKNDDSPYFGLRIGKPGTGDGLNDSAEVAAWDLLMGAGSWSLDLDGDGIHNLLDPDSDGDGLLDGEEYLARGTHMGRFDTDNDALLDGYDLLVTAGDPRFVRFTQAGILYTDLDAGRLFHGELTAGTDPLQWDTDGDGLPDSYEVYYGLNPRNPLDAGLDPDRDSYNPDGGATPVRPWTNLDEYRYGMPASWNVPTHGVWWWGTHPLNPDTDGDGVLDGVEVHFGTNPTNGASRDPRHADVNGQPTDEVWRNDPTNQNLPEELMDPTNLQYLRDGRVDASEEADELAAVIDQAISAAIAGNVTEALAVIYEATPLAPLVHTGLATVELAEEALLALVKCVDTEAEALLDVATTLADTTQCVSSVLLPFVDALLNRTVEELPLVGDTVAELRQETLPGIVDTVDRITPLDLQATNQALLQNPIAAAPQASLDVVDMVSSPENLQEAVVQSQAAIQVVVADLIQATERHPQFLYDTILRENLDAHWPAIQEANDATAATGTGPIQVVDSLVFNLYTNRNDSERVTSIAVGDRTCIQLSTSDTSTRDSNDCDMYATLTVSHGTAQSPGGVPTLGKRVTPSLLLETAVPTASFELEALGYLQLPDSPHIVVLGYATTGSGQPQSWTGTLLEYDAKQAWSNRALAYASTYDDARNAIPLHLVAGSFEVEVSTPGKPVVDGEQTVLELESTAVPSSVSVDVRRLDVGGQHRVEASLDANAAATWSLLHRDGLGDHESRLQFAATSLPSGTHRITHTVRDAMDASWQWSSPATTGTLEAAYQEFFDDVAVRSFDASGTDVPGAVLLRSDAQSHLHAYQATNAPATLSLLMAEGAGACPALADRFLVVEKDTASLCVTASLDGYTALQAQDLDNRFHVTGTRASASTDPTTVLVRDGNTAYAQLSASPTQWNGTFTTSPTNIRTLDWSANTPLAGVTLEADLADELLRVELTSVPVTVSTTLDAARGLGQLSAADYVGNLEWITSTTGNAPSAAALGDHIRFRELSSGIEASWSIRDARDVLARVTEDGAWQATGSFSSTRPLEVYYEDESRLVQLEAASVTGEFLFRVSDDAGRGLFTYQHELAAPSPVVRLAGNLAGNGVLIDLTNAPAEMALSTRLDAQSVTMTASEIVGSLEARYAPDGKHPTTNRDAFLVVGGTTTPLPGLHVKVEGISSLDVVRSPATLQLEVTPALASPLLVRFEQGQDATVIDLETVPTELTATRGEGLLSWSSNAAATSFTYLARDASASSYLSASATDAPESLTVSWTPRAIDTFQASVSHSAANLPELVVEDRRSAAGQTAGDAGFHFTGTDLPSQVSTRFEPVQGRLTATALTAAGAPSAAGFLDVGFGERRQGRLQSPSSTGTLAFLEETDAGIAGALRSTGLEELMVRLFGAEGESDSAGTVSLQRAEGGAVYIRADSASRDAHGIVHYDAAPASIEASLWPGTSAGGFRIESHSASSAGALSAGLVRDGRSLAATTSPTPADLVASWTPGSVVAVTASSPATVTVQATPQGADVPGQPGDYVVAKQSNAGSLFALRLSSVESFRLDPALGTLDADVGGGTPILVDYAPGAERLRIHANPLPAGFTASWNPTLRTLNLDASSAMTRFLVSTDPGNVGGQRLLGILDGVPTGVTTFSASPNGVFTLNAPSALSVARITSDAGTGAASTLDGLGVRVQASGEQPAFFLNLPGVKRAELLLPAGGAPRLETDGASSASPAEIRLGLPAQRLMGHLDSLPGGAMTLTWPSPTAMTFTAVGAPSGITLGMDAGSDRSQVKLTGGPGSWSHGFTEAGAITYTANGGASGLDAFAAWHGAAYILDADGVPTGITVVPASGMQSGQINGGGVGRLKLALASSGGSGAAAVPSVDSSNRDVFAVDTTTGGGLLSVDLPDVQSLSWSLPDGVGRVTGTPLSVDLNRASASTRTGVVQLVHPDHQSYASFPGGLPAGLDMELSRTTAKWTLAMDAAGKDYVFQHQGSDAGSLRVESIGAPTASTLSFEPRATRALDYSATGAASRLVVQSRWSGGFIDTDLTNVPNKFRVDSGGSTLQEGSASTLGSGSVGHAKLLLVPDAADTANRVNPSWEHLAVEATGKTPYLGLNIAGLSTASWQLPEATGNRPVMGSIERASRVPGNTWMVLSGPREDVTVKAVDSSPVLSFAVTPSTNTAGNLNPQPLRVVLECALGTVSQLDLTHIHAETGQLVSAVVEGCQSQTIMEGSGVEPSRVGYEAPLAPNRVRFQTVDGGTALALDVQDPTSKVQAVVTRGTCGLTEPFQGSISTLGTGNAGTVTAFIGDGGIVPNLGTWFALEARCTPGQGHFGMRLPNVQETSWSVNQCVHDYSFDAGTQPATYTVETPQGFLQMAAQLQSQSDGTIVFTGREIDGIRHAASDRFAFLSETVTFPTCMDFQAPLESYTLSGTSIPGDLAINLNPQPGTNGQLFDTVRIFSQSGDSSGPLTLLGKLGKVANLNEYRAQLEYLSPFDRLEVHLYDGASPRTAQGINAERVVAVRNSDYFDYHTVFHDAQLVKGDVEHLSCGGDDTINMEYLRIPGRAKKPITFIADLGMDCDRQRFDMNAYSDDMEYTIEWDHLLNNKIEARLSQPLESLHWWRMSHRIGETQVRAGHPSAWYVAVNGAPAGTLEVGVRPGVAGKIVAGSTGGTLASIDVGISATDSSTSYVSLHMANVKLRIEWDLDGDTRHSGNPRYVFADTGGQFLSPTLRIRFGAVGFGVNGGGVLYDDYQLKWGMKDLGIVSLPWFKKAGSMNALHGLQLEVLLSGKWHVVPRNLFT